MLSNMVFSSKNVKWSVVKEFFFARFLKVKNIKHGSDMVVMKKCTEIWAVYDEVQDELKASMTGF